MGKTCDGLAVYNPVTWEQSAFAILSLAFGWIVYQTHDAYVHKMEQLRENGKNRMVSSIRYHFLGVRLPCIDESYSAGLIDLGFLIIYEFFFSFGLLRYCLSNIPQFSHALVTDPRSDDPGFGRLLVWCQIQFSIHLLTPAVFNWAQFRLIYSRLFIVFEPAVTLRFSDRFVRSITAFIDIVALFYLAIFVSYLSSGPSCAEKWRPLEWSDSSTKQWFWTCGARQNQGSDVSIIVAILFVYILMIAFQIATLWLFIRQFSQLIDMSSGNDPTQMASSHVRGMIEVMSKLTTLTVSAILSTFLSFLLLIPQFLIGRATRSSISSSSFLFADWLFNLLCMLLVFKWNRKQYQLLCENPYCFVNRWVKQKWGVESMKARASRVYSPESSVVGSADIGSRTNGSNHDVDSDVEL